MTDDHTLAGLIERLKEGEEQAYSEVFSIVYQNLYTLAQRQRRRWVGDYTLNTTALVHEAYLKLLGNEDLDWNNKAHFLGVAAKAMRHILINYAQKRLAQKRGGDTQTYTLDESIEKVGCTIEFSEQGAQRLIDLDAALQDFTEVAERESKVVECRFFGDMTIKETAAALGISEATVKRDWAIAQAWLFRRLSG